MSCKISAVACIVSITTIAAASCFERFYVDEACQLNRCPDPTTPCGTASWLNNGPVYTTNQIANGHQRWPEDSLCRMRWFTKDNLGNCTIPNTCDRWTGGFKLTTSCRVQIK